MKSEAWFCVTVIDQITEEEVVVADFCTRAEASELARVISKYGACKVIVAGSEFVRSN